MSGRDVASEVIEEAVAGPTVDEALAPFRRQVAESKMSDAEIEEFFRDELESHRRETRAKRA